MRRVEMGSSDREPEVALHEIEIGILVQQDVAVLQAERPYDDVDRLADRGARPAHRTIVSSCRHREIVIEHAAEGELPEVALDPGRMSLVTRTLQHFE